MKKPTLRKILAREITPSTEGWKKPVRDFSSKIKKDAIVDCGWGRLLFAQTFESSETLAATLCEESSGRRDIALYLRDPHVVLNSAPLELFLDPSHTYRMKFEHYRPSKLRPRGFSIRRVKDLSDFKSINRIYKKRKMVPVSSSIAKEDLRSRSKTWLVAQETKSKRIIATVLGVDHVHCFKDPEGGSSLWSLAVDPDTHCMGIGEALVRYLIEHFQARGRAYMDLSVMHNNSEAIALYEKLGFHRVPVFCVKHKNAINEPLFTSSRDRSISKLNPYAKIIVDEARRRGISTEVIDAKKNLFQLSFGGREIRCHESLTDLTSSISFAYCSDKSLTHSILKKEKLRVPHQSLLDSEKTLRSFLEKHKRIVIKPANGEQGKDVFVDLRKITEAKRAWEEVKQSSNSVIVEEFVEGQDLRVVVIDYQVVAASLRVPARILGTGRHTIKQLIEKRNRRTLAATGGESKIPFDSETERCIHQAGFKLDSKLPENFELQVRKTANLHSGGSMHDVTDQLHPKLVEASERAARALQIPVVGLDLLVREVKEDSYVIIEANERPGLANHEPQPTAERFIDLLFPQTKA